MPIWDGSISIGTSSDNWKHDPDTGICSTQIDQDIFALFLDEGHRICFLMLQGGVLNSGCR